MSISKRLRFAVLERDGFRCRYCGATAADDRLEVDHVHPSSKGGPDIMANLVTACYSCNRGKKHYSLPVPELKRILTANGVQIRPSRPAPMPPKPDSLKEDWKATEHISSILDRVYDGLSAIARLDA